MTDSQEGEAIIADLDDKFLRHHGHAKPHNRQ